MHTELVRARLTKIEEEIAAFERWQQDSMAPFPPGIPAMRELGLDDPFF